MATGRERIKLEIGDADTLELFHRVARTEKSIAQSVPAGFGKSDGVPGVVLAAEAFNVMLLIERYSNWTSISIIQ